MIDDREERDEELRALGKELPWPAPDEARVESLRASLLVAAKADVPQKSRWLAVGGGFVAGAVVAAAATLLVVMHGSAPSVAPVAPIASVSEPVQIEGTAAADFERQITRSAHGVDEIVRVHGGRISIAVGALAADQRVRVATGNAEVEGQGRYDVAVANDAIEEVAVKEGAATVRVTGQQAVFLASGQTWRAPAMTTQLAMIPTPAPAPTSIVTPPKSTPTPAAITPPPVASRPIVSGPHIEQHADHIDHADHVEPPLTPTASADPAQPLVAATPPAFATSKPNATELERHFEAGYKSLKAGNAAEAARELGAAADARGNDALAADARYLEAVALVRAGRKTEAEGALVAYLDAAPHAVRRGRAAVMLARLIAERGDQASARKWFESALGDSDPDVAAAARAGVR